MIPVQKVLKHSNHFPLLSFAFSNPSPHTSPDLRRQSRYPSPPRYSDQHPCHSNPCPCRKCHPHRMPYWVHTRKCRCRSGQVRSGRSPVPTGFNAKPSVVTSALLFPLIGTQVKMLKVNRNCFRSHTTSDTIDAKIMIIPRDRLSGC